jgi:diacylglycerol kinase (ATP)
VQRSFAQTLTVHRRLDAALDVIANGKVVDVDLDIVNGAYFANVASIGLSADVAGRTPIWLKRILEPAS